MTNWRITQRRYHDLKQKKWNWMCVGDTDIGIRTKPDTVHQTECLWGPLSLFQIQVCQAGRGNVLVLHWIFPRRWCGWVSTFLGFLLIVPFLVSRGSLLPFSSWSLQAFLFLFGWLSVTQERPACFACLFHPARTVSPACPAQPVSADHVARALPVCLAHPALSVLSGWPVSCLTSLAQPSMPASAHSARFSHLGIHADFTCWLFSRSMPCANSDFMTKT